MTTRLGRFNFFVLFGYFIVALMSASASRADELQDLSDYMSPSDIEEELTLKSDNLPNLFWSPAFEVPRLQIVVNKAERGTAQDAQTLEAFLDGVLYHRVTVSTAKEREVQAPPSRRYPDGHVYFAHTPEGTFRIFKRARNYVSQTWPGASMPYAQFFIGGIALHATTSDHYSALGRRDSGGCVRMHPRDAKVIWDLVGSIGVQATEVTVYDGSQAPHPFTISHP